MDADLLESRAGDADVPQRRRHRARGRAAADHGRQLEVVGDRGRPAVHPGQGHRQLDQHEGGRGGVPRARAAPPRLRRRRCRHGVRRGGPGHRRRAARRHLRPRLRPAHRHRLPARGHHLRPERARGRDRDRGARPLREELPRGAAADQGALPGRAHERRHLEPQLLVPRQRPPARGDARGLPLPRDPRRARHGDRQRRPARGLRRRRARAARGDRGRAVRPPARRDRAPRRAGEPCEGRGHDARARPVVARGARRGAAVARARARHRRLHRGGHRGGAPARASARST